MWRAAIESEDREDGLMRFNLLVVLYPYNIQRGCGGEDTCSMFCSLYICSASMGGTNKEEG